MGSFIGYAELIKIIKIVIQFNSLAKECMNPDQAEGPTLRNAVSSGAFRQANSR